MAKAREIMDRVTAAMQAGDEASLRALYADDAVAETPDVGRLTGGSAIVNYLMSFRRAFPDASYESTNALERGSTAVDEGFIVGTNTGILATPEGDVPPTGRKVRLRSIDVLDIVGGKGVSHRFYFDQLELLTQLGLAGEDTTIVLPDEQARAGRSPAR